MISFRQIIFMKCVKEDYVGYNSCIAGGRGYFKLYAIENEMCIYNRTVTVLPMKCRFVGMQV